MTAALAATMLLAGPAAAVTVTGAKTIRITNLVPTWLQVGEVQAIEAVTGTNVALTSNGGTATGSGNYDTTSTPDKAIDGLAPVSYPLIYHSDSAAAEEFLLITLAAPTSLSSLTVFGRADFGSRDLFGITIFDSLGATLFSGQLDNRALAGGGNTLTFDVAPPVGGVPEPASWALMIGGFGLVGGAMRRRGANADGLASRAAA
ncbi:PEPxxWA-CTERM sorting domain-containing protein [Glacieibacterium frigidum]|nr:PEPxxWA-CTERM sorting domain-containing protein [Glacieibacterium frigidum]